MLTLLLVALGGVYIYLMVVSMLSAKDDVYSVQEIETDPDLPAVSQSATHSIWSVLLQSDPEPEPVRNLDLQ